MKQIRHLILGLLLIFAGACFAQVQNIEDTSPLSAEQFKRYTDLTRELRCLVCQNQNIADSEAPLALDLRNQVRKQIAAGKSNSQIFTYLKARYGDFVFYRPPFQRNTFLLWCLPFGLVLLGLLLAWSYTRKAKQAAFVEPVDPAEIARLVAELKNPQ